MTKLSKARQEEAASAGIIPLLKKVIKGTSRLDQFALPIFCELANAGKVSRRLLWKNDGLQRMSFLQWSRLADGSVPQITWGSILAWTGS